MRHLVFVVLFVIFVTLVIAQAVPVPESGSGAAEKNAAETVTELSTESDTKETDAPAVVENALDPTAVVTEKVESIEQISTEEATVKSTEQISTEDATVKSTEQISTEEATVESTVKTEVVKNTEKPVHNRPKYPMHWKWKTGEKRV